MCFDKLTTAVKLFKEERFLKDLLLQIKITLSVLHGAYGVLKIPAGIQHLSYVMHFAERPDVHWPAHNGCDRTVSKKLPLVYFFLF